MSEPEHPAALFPLVRHSDGEIVRLLIMSIRRAISRSDLTAGQIHHLAVLLFGLEQLPLATPGIAVDLTLSRRSGDDMHYVTVVLDSDTFSFWTGGSIYTPGAGGDSFSDDAFRVEVGGYRNVDLPACVNWFERFNNDIADPSAEVKIDNEGGDPDWSLAPDESAWEHAAKLCDDADNGDEYLA